MREIVKERERERKRKRKKRKKRKREREREKKRERENSPRLAVSGAEKFSSQKPVIDDVEGESTVSVSYRKFHYY